MSLIRVAAKSGYFTVRGAVTFVTSQMPGGMVMSFSKEQLYVMTVDLLTLSAAKQFPGQPIMLLNVYTRLDKPYEFLQLRGSVICMSEKDTAVIYRSGTMPSRVYNPIQDDRCPFCADRSSMMDITCFASLRRQYLCQTCGESVVGTRISMTV